MKRLALAGLLLSVVLLLSAVFAHPALNTFVYVVPDEDGHTMTHNLSGSFFTNPTASSGQVFDLPAAAPGLHYTFAVAAAQYMEVNPQGGDQIVGVGFSTSMGDAIRSSTAVGTLIELVAVDSDRWLVIRSIGTWTDED